MPYWQYDAAREPLEAKLARLDLHREKARLRLALLGADPVPDDGSGLPPEKRAMARMIVEDYEALISEIAPKAGAILLPSERQMLEQLQADQRRDFETLLTPDELTEYLVRNSPTGETLRREFHRVDLSEGEFRAVFEAYRNSRPKQSWRNST